MSSKDKLGIKELLSGLEGPFEQSKIFKIRTGVPNLSIDLGEGRTPAACLATSEVHVEQARASLWTSEVRRDGFGDVRTGDVHGDGEFSGRLDQLLTAAGGHGEGIFAPVNAATQGQEGIPEGLAGIVHLGPLSRKLGSIHPITAGLDVLDGRNLGPDQIGYGLRHRNARHGGRVQQSLDRLFPTGHGGARNSQIGMSRHRHV
mmetsp:Transcript_5989/g.12796  ORF Transcript_5989/g.12796 Transcript_5989/m.12796 type:complete len:203 (-) Transcript_5989:2218-2826(-)